MGALSFANRDYLHDDQSIWSLLEIVCRNLCRGLVTYWLLVQPNTIMLNLLAKKSGQKHFKTGAQY